MTTKVSEKRSYNHKTQNSFLLEWVTLMGYCLLALTFYLKFKEEVLEPKYFSEPAEVSKAKQIIKKF